jgi:hypothetical protein
MQLDKRVPCILSNGMGDCIEREIFKGLDLHQIKKAFQKKKERQMQLPRSPR